MSSTTTERGESPGFVAETLRRPIQEAVREGVREAMREERRRQGPPGERSGEDEGGSGRGKYALLALLGIGMAAFLLWRRNGGSGGPGGMTESIRQQSKTGQSGSGGSGSTRSEAEMGGAVETAEESVETEDAAPGASSE